MPRRVERYARDGVSVCGVVLQQGISGARVPDLDRVVHTTCGKGRPIRRETHARHVVRVVVEHVAACSCKHSRATPCRPPPGLEPRTPRPRRTGFSVPQADSLVVAGRRNGAGIRAEHSRPHPICVAIERPDKAPGRNGPHLDRLIIRRCEKVLRVPAEVYAANRRRVAFHALAVAAAAHGSLGGWAAQERSEGRGTERIAHVIASHRGSPEANRVIFRPRSEERTVGAERNALHGPLGHTTRSRRGRHQKYYSLDHAVA